MSSSLLTRYRKQLDGFLVEYRHAAQLVKEEKAALREAHDNVKAASVAQGLVQEAALQVQNQVHHQLAAVVSKSLATVFSDPYQFSIKFERKRGKTEASLVFKRGELELEDPATEAGVGQVDVAALALRLACLMLMRPRKRLCLILDEPFKNVNGEMNRKRAAELLLSLARSLKCQIIMSTGYEWLKIGKVIDMEQLDGTRLDGF